jgi:hypothetical protein
MMSERQQTAQNLARSIGALPGAFVVSPLPLTAGAHLRVHAEHPHCDRIRTEIESWGWKVVHLTNTARFHAPDGTMRLTEVLEVQIDADRQPIADTRRIPTAEPAANRKKSHEVEAMLKAWRGK